MNKYGDLLFDDENKRILIPNFIGYSILDNKSFAIICSKLLLKQSIDGTYYTQGGNMAYIIDSEGRVKTHFDARRILLANF